MAKLEIRFTTSAEQYVRQNGGAVLLVETRDSRIG